MPAADTKSNFTVGSSTYQRIKRDIIFGTLAPASKLKLDTLREKYSVSMSTLRETLNPLASEGFVAAEEQRGFFVTAVSREDLIEIANLRVLLECHALDLSVRNGDTDWEGNLVAASQASPYGAENAGGRHVVHRRLEAV